MSKNIHRRERALDNEKLEKLIYLQSLSKTINDYLKLEKTSFQHLLESGESVRVMNAHGAEIGSVSVTVPGKKAVIEDYSVVLPAAEAAGYEIEEYLNTEMGLDVFEELVSVIREHAPWLEQHVVGLRLTEEDEKELSEQVLEQWQATGQVPMGWGIKESSRSYVRIAPNKTGRATTKHVLAPEIRELMA